MITKGMLREFRYCSSLAKKTARRVIRVADRRADRVELIQAIESMHAPEPEGLEEIQSRYRMEIKYRQAWDLIRAQYNCRYILVYVEIKP